MVPPFPPDLLMATVLLRPHWTRPPSADWWGPLLACIVIALLAGYGTFAASRDHLDMEASYSLPIAGLTGSLILYWLTR